MEEYTRRYKKHIIVIGLALLLLLSTAFKSRNTVEQKHFNDLLTVKSIFTDPDDGFAKPIADKCKYQIQKLKNGINCLIVKTPDQFGVGIAVAIKGLGSENDDFNIRGKAHLIEYSNDDDDIITNVMKNQGMINGLTYLNYTIYPIIVPEQNMLQDIIDRVSDFLSEPLLNFQISTSEMFSINSEFDQSLLEGGKRSLSNFLSLLYQKSNLSNINSPLKDNQTNLNNTIINLENEQQFQKEIQEYFENYYIPENIYIVLQTHADQTNEQIQEQLNKFEKIQNKKQKINTNKDILYNANLTFEQNQQNKSQTNQTINYQQNQNFEDIKSIFNKDAKSSIYKIKQLAPLKQLSLVFEIPLMNNQETNSLYFIQNYFQANGICQKLQLQGYFFKCQYIVEELNQYQALFIVDIDLALEGIYKLSSLIAEFFKDFKYFSDQQNTLQNYNMTSENYNQFFNYSELQTSQFSYLIFLAQQFQKLQRSDLIYQKFNFKQWEPSEIDKMARLLNIHNSIIVIRANSFSEFLIGENGQTNSIQKLIRDNDNFDFNNEFQITYKKIQLDSLKIKEYELLINTKTNIQVQDEQSQFTMGFSLPNSLNIQTQLLDSEEPQLIKQIGRHQLFYFSDIYSNLPKEYIKILFEYHQKDVKLNISNIQQEEILKTFQTNVQTKVFDHYLYNTLLLIHDQVQITTRGVELILPCFSLNCGHQVDSLAYFLDQSLNDPKIYEQIKNRAQFMIQERFQSSPLSDVIANLDYLLTFHSFPNDFLLNYIKHETNFNVLNTEYQQYYKNLTTTFLIGGNADKIRSKALFEYILHKLKLVENKQKIQKQNENSNNIKDQQGKYYGYQLEQNTTMALRLFSKEFDKLNYAIGNYYQISTINNEKQFKILQIIQIHLNSFAFKFLREQNQIGYDVGAIIKNYGGKFGIFVYAQGYKHRPHEMNQLLDKCLSNFEDYLNQQLEENYDYNQNLQQSKTAKKFTSLLPKLEYLWRQVTDQSSINNNKKEKTEDIKIFKNDIISYFKLWFQTNKTMLSIQIDNEFINDKLFIEENHKEREQLYKDLEIVGTIIQISDNKNSQIILQKQTPNQIQDQIFLKQFINNSTQQIYDFQSREDSED